MRHYETTMQTIYRLGFYVMLGFIASHFIFNH